MASYVQKRVEVFPFLSLAFTSFQNGYQKLLSKFSAVFTGTDQATKREAHVPVPLPGTAQLV